MPDSKLKEEFLAIMDRKDHWAWKFFSGEKVSIDQLKIHFTQEYAVYVRDFPVFLGRILGKNPPAEVRRDLAENIFEEETGRLSMTGPHPLLFLKMMEGIGFSQSMFENASLLPESRLYRKWLDDVTLNGSWQEGAAVMAIFVEGSVKDRKEIDDSVPDQSEDIEKKIRDHPLVRFHGVDPGCMDLIRAHSLVERGHRKAAWRMVLGNLGTREMKSKVRSALEKSLKLWLGYRDGIAASCNFDKNMKG